MKKRTERDTSSSSNEFVARNNLTVDSQWKSTGEKDRSLPAEHAEDTRARARASACEPTSARASERACARLRRLWRAMRPGSKFNRLASRWLGVMTTRAEGSTSANWGQPCQTTAIGCWETNVVVLATLRSLCSRRWKVLLGKYEKERRERACASSPLTASPAPVANFDTYSGENYFPATYKNYIWEKIILLSQADEKKRIFRCIFNFVQHSGYNVRNIMWH